MYHIAHVLNLVAPQNKTLPIIYDSPHSGTYLPKEFKHHVSLHDIRQSEDTLVDALFEQAPKHHAFFLKSLFSRVYIDLNRAIDDIDPALISPISLKKTQMICKPTTKSQAGHGLIWKQTVSGKMLYEKLLDCSDIQHRIENYWQPYHDMLEKLYRRLYRQFNYSLHLNCHSMPSRALKSNVDIILGDGHGQTSDDALNDFLQESFRKQGFQVRMNVPYSGAYIVKNYANPANDCYNIQIEINRALYMDEQTLSPNQNFTAMQDALNRIMADIANYVQHTISHDRTSYAAE